MVSFSGSRPFLSGSTRLGALSCTVRNVPWPLAVTGLSELAATARTHHKVSRDRSTPGVPELCLMSLYPQHNFISRWATFPEPPEWNGPQPATSATKCSQPVVTGGRHRSFLAANPRPSAGLRPDAAPNEPCCLALPTAHCPLPMSFPVLRITT